MKFKAKCVIQVVFVIIVSHLLFSCGGEEKQVKDIIAEVNKAYITGSEIEARIPDNLTDDMKAALKRKFMDEWIEREIFYQTAVKEDMKLSDDELQMIDNYRKELLVQKYLNKYVNKTYHILDREVEEYYKNNKEEFKWYADHVHIIHLVVKSYDASLFKEISQSKNLLTIIEKNYFDQQSSLENPIGDLGYVKLDELPAELKNAIKGMRTGDISKQIKSEYGYHFIQLLDFQRAGTWKEMDLVKEEIIRRIKLQKRKKEIEELKNKLRVEFSIQTHLSKL
jgi:peptidyl-prolyl cis-trans isomerase C